MSESSKRILIIEDNQDNRQLVTWLLEDEGYSVCCAASAEQGITLLEDLHCDMVLMDIALPGMDGKEATQEIHANPCHADLPIIALTAYAEEKMKTYIRSCGVEAIITKPFDETQLLNAIKRVTH